MEQQINSFDLGRVVSEHKDRYFVKIAEKELDAELIGSLRFTGVGKSNLLNNLSGKTLMETGHISRHISRHISISVNKQKKKNKY